jgi:peptidoglycan/xylan/chitin deacetylase (PgdA/CDA1 family)
MRLRGLRIGCAVATVVGAAVVAISAPAAALDANLVADPGFEAAAAGWTPDSWGSNDAALDLVPDAHSGTTAARVTITNYTDGDAKWLPDPVAVTPGGDYAFSDWYEASTPTELWAQFATSSGALSYVHLAGVAPAATWTPTAVSLEVPATAVSVRVLHVLASAGTLVVDDVALTATTRCTPAPVDGVPNGSFDDACPAAADGVPAGWTADGTGAYGDTAATPDGSHAVTVQDAVDGQEAGLTTTLPGVAPGQRYRLSFLQSGDTYVYAYLTITRTTGAVSSQSLPSAPATGGAWSRYSAAFVTPADLRSLSVTIATSAPGTVALDSVTLTALPNQVPANFAAGMVSLTFDDGDSSVFRNGWPAMRSRGYHGTFYVNAGTLNSSGFLTTAQVQDLAAAGNEIGSHLYHHSDLVQLDTATLAAELSGNAASLQRILGSATPVTAFASPFGSYTSGAIDTVMRYASSHRTSDGAMNTKADLDPRTIHAKLVTSSMTAAAVGALVRQAKASHSWLVLIYHNIAASSASQPAGESGYTVTPTAFKAQLAAIAKTGITVQPLTSALTTLSAQ